MTPNPHKTDAPETRRMAVAAIVAGAFSLVPLLLAAQSLPAPPAPPAAPALRSLPPAPPAPPRHRPLRRQSRVRVEANGATVDVSAPRYGDEIVVDVPEIDIPEIRIPAVPHVPRVHIPAFHERVMVPPVPAIPAIPPVPAMALAVPPVPPLPQVDAEAIRRNVRRELERARRQIDRELRELQRQEEMARRR